MTAQRTSFSGVTPYASVGFADEYFGATLAKNATWSSMSDANKLAALKQATLEIDALFFIVRKINVNQPREWPRFLDMGTYGDLTGLDDDLPEDVCMACCEQAYYIAKNFQEGADHDARRDHQDQGLASISREGGSENYDLEKARRTPVCSDAMQLLRPFIAMTGNLEDPYAQPPRHPHSMG